VVFFDNVLVPWERVFLLGDVDLLNGTATTTNSMTHTAHQGAAKNIAKCEFVLGLALLMTKTLGNAQLPHSEERLGELMLYTELMKACMRAAEADARLDEWGVMCPAALPAESTRNLFMTAYPRMVEILQLLGSSSFMLTPTEADFSGPLASHIEQYLATDTATARDRVSSSGWRGTSPQRLRQPSGALRAILRQRPADPRARPQRHLPQGRDDGARAAVSGRRVGLTRASRV